MNLPSINGTFKTLTAIALFSASSVVVAMEPTSIQVQQQQVLKVQEDMQAASQKMEKAQNLTDTEKSQQDKAKTQVDSETKKVVQTN